MSSEETTHEFTPIETIVPSQGPLPVIDGYEIMSLLGRGGMGRVYKARQHKLDRFVAVKMLIDASDDMLTARFQAESQAVARLQHPNIAQIFETGIASEQPFFVLEYLDGGTLAQKLNGKPQEPIECARMIETLARAIEHSHQHDILHRDLKPANILLDADGNPKITDFGLAKHLHENSKITRTGEVLGTPSYMAPEQASGVTSKLGPALDIYALGAILYEMLTGRPPFQGPDSMQTLMMVLTMEPVSPRGLQPQVPRDLETICLKCLEKSPRKRYATAAELADDLRRYQDGVPILARPVGMVERTVKWAKRRPAVALLVLVGILSVILLIAEVVRIEASNRELAKSIDETEKSNRRLQVSIRETKESLDVARNAIDSMLVRLSDQLAPLPQSDLLRRESLEDARKLYERISAIRPEDSEGRSQAAEALGKLGKIYNDLGRMDDAEATYRKTLALQAELKTLEPDQPDHRRGHANMTLNLANLEQKRGNTAQAETLARAALSEIEPLLKRPDAVTLHSASSMHNTLGLTFRSQKKFDDAEQSHQAALKLRRQWLALEPGNSEAKIAVAASLSNLGAIQLFRNRPAEAAAGFAEAEQMLAEQTSPQQRFYLGQFQANRAIANEVLKKDAQAEEAHALAVKTLTALVADHSAVPGYRHALAKEHLNFARFHGPRGRSEEALRHLRIAGPMFDRLVKENGDNQQFRADRALCTKITGWVEADIADAKKKSKTNK